MLEFMGFDVDHIPVEKVSSVSCPAIKRFEIEAASTVAKAHS